jgi:hypothetical protein
LLRRRLPQPSPSEAPAAAKVMAEVAKGAAPTTTNAGQSAETEAEKNARKTFENGADRQVPWTHTTLISTACGTSPSPEWWPAARQVQRFLQSAIASFVRAPPAPHLQAATKRVRRHVSVGGGRQTDHVPGHRHVGEGPVADSRCVVGRARISAPDPRRWSNAELHVRL